MVTYPEWDMLHVRDPHAANVKAFFRCDADRIAVGVGGNCRRIVDLYDRISLGVDERELLRRSFRCGYETVICK